MKDKSRKTNNQSKKSFVNNSNNQQIQSILGDDFT